MHFLADKQKTNQIKKLRVIKKLSFRACIWFLHIKSQHQMSNNYSISSSISFPEKALSPLTSKAVTLWLEPRYHWLILDAFPKKGLIRA